MFVPSVIPRVTAVLTALEASPDSGTSQTKPEPTLPSTAVTGTRRASEALPASTLMVAAIPAKTFWSPGTEQRISTLVPSPEVVVFEPFSPVVVEVADLVPTFKLLHWKGAGPPSSVRVAAVGALVSRYCWAALTVPVAE